MKYRKKLIAFAAMIVSMMAMSLGIAPGAYAASTPNVPTPMSAGTGAVPMVNGKAVTSAAITTYTTTNSCSVTNSLGTSPIYATITWQLNGNYDRPSSIYWHTAYNFLDEVDWYWEQGTYVAQSSVIYYAQPHLLDTITLDTSLYPWLYKPNHDNYVRLYFYNNGTKLCEDKVTD